MSSVGQPSDIRFRTGAVFGTTFSVFFSNFLIFAVVPMIVLAPFEFMGVTQPTIQPDGTPSFNVLGILIYVIISIILSIFLLDTALRILQGLGLAPGESLQKSVVLFFPVIAASILVWIGVTLGFILLIVPGIIVALMLMVTVPALIAERPGIIGSIDRSRQLTKGHRWGLLGMLLLMILILIVASIVVAIALFATGAIQLPDPNDPTFEPMPPTTGQMVANVVFTGIYAGFNTCFSASIYQALRNEEAVAGGQVSAV